MFWVYILYSERFDKYYIGQTKDVTKRLLHHNAGLNKFTKTYLPWSLFFTIEESSRAEALQLEKRLKNLSRLRLKDFISKFKK